MEGEKDGGAGNGVDWDGSRRRKCGWGGINLPHSGLLLGVGNRSRDIEIIW